MSSETPVFGPRVMTHFGRSPFKAGGRECAVCFHRVKDNRLAMASHARKHVREGTAVEKQEFRADGPVVRFYVNGKGA